MILKTILYTLGHVTVLFGLAATAHAAEPDPLFADNSVIDVTVSAPFKQIMRKRPEEDYVPGTFEFVDASGNTVSLDVGIRTRGKFRRRRDICPFAPLRINFKKSQLDKTIFDEQDKLKLVTHCRNNSSRYDQAVLTEYLAYRILNVLTDLSFRVRLLRVTYIYTDDDNDEVAGYAILLEHKDRLAQRLELEEQEIVKVSIRRLQPEYTNLTSVFQYLIGNTDFSPIAGAAGEFCCHNHVLFGKAESPYWSVPYDFDQAGIVDAPHAGPNPKFRLRSVRERIYRGRCINSELLPHTLDLFRVKRSEIEALISDRPELQKGLRRSIMSYIWSFYNTIDDEKRVDKKLTKACR